MSVHVIGSFPSPLYRAFDKEEYARCFVEQGVFRLLPLEHYCEIEDRNRRDKGEGESKWIIRMKRSPGNEFVDVECGTLSGGNLRYILCFSGPGVDVRYLACRYGRYVVRLSDPMKLVNDIAAHLEQRPELPKWISLDCVPVRYDKGQLVSRLPEFEERLTMSYGQKDPEFSNDCEYRLVLTLPISIDSCPLEIEIRLQKKLEHVKLLRL